MRMSFDDQYLFTVSEDACLFIFKAVDKEGRGMKRDKEVGYAEEILITKSDLEEKVRMKRLRNEWNFRAVVLHALRTYPSCTEEKIYFQWCSGMICVNKKAGFHEVAFLWWTIFPSQWKRGRELVDKVEKSQNDMNW